MSRLDTALERASAQNRSALIAYLCAGDPSLEATPALACAAAEAGADILEIGVPFSDPSADGPAIQRASERALAAGTTLRGVLAAVAKIRERTDVPVILFGYYNPILAYGEEALCRDAKAAGVDGLLVVDLPPEECAPLREPALAAGLDWVPLVAPTSDASRLAVAAAVATSFVYSISMAGVTGAGHADLAAAAQRAASVRDATGKKVAVGFGVQSADDVRALATHADGVVVGSALVRAAAEGGEPALRALVSALREGLPRGTR